MRLFVASRLVAETRRRLRPALDGLVASSNGLLRAVPEESEHFTHLFLGERPPLADPILEALRPLAKRQAWSVTLDGPVVFPAKGRPRLVCLGVAEGEARLLRLGEEVRTLLSPLLPDLDSYRLKTPHVTLARFRRRAASGDRRIVEAAIEPLRAVLPASTEIGNVELIRSQLKPSGAAYATLGEIAFVPRALRRT